MNINWNAEGYSKNFSFVHEYGEGILNLIEFKTGKILDLGCGNGALTKKLYDMGADVTGMDASEEMLKIAEKEYPEIKFIHADASDFRTEEKFDTVFSNAVFHWIDNQDGLLSGINSALKENGELVCEFGGFGCCERIHSALEKAFAERGLEYRRTFYFPTIGEYAARMENHGLLVKYAALFDRKTQLKGENGMMDWINMFVKLPFEGIDGGTAQEIKEKAVQSLEYMREDGVWYADYVRIRIRAVKVR